MRNIVQRRQWLIALSLVLLVVPLIACGGGSRTVSSEVVTGGWTPITKFEGKEDTKTATFTVPENAEEWKMKWNTRPGDAGFGKLKVVAFNGTDEEIGTQANVIGSSLGEFVNKGTGTFYFVVETNQPYTLTVEWKKPS